MSSSRQVSPALSGIALLNNPLKTRSGKHFSPYLNANPVACPPSFDLGLLLRESVASESDDLSESLLPDQLEEDGDEQPLMKEDNRPRAQKRPPSPPAPSVSRSHKKRRTARNKAAVEGGQFPSARTVSSHVAPSIPIPTELVTEGLPAAKGGYSARPDKAPAAQKALLAMQLAEEEGFEYIAWDGLCVRP